MSTTTYRHALVTGGAGFVGSALALSLRRTFSGMAVTALDNLRRLGSERNLPRLAAGGVQFVHGDIRNLADLMAVDPEPDLIIECSAEPSAQAGYGGSPEYLMATNLTGCFHCLELARRSKADFLFVSTSRVYPYTRLNALPYTEEETRFALVPEDGSAGATERGINERFPLDGPRSLYGMTKLAAELMVEEYADAYGFRFIVNRAGLLTGPRQMAKSDQGVMALWMAAHYFSAPLSYIGFGGRGKQVRDFLHIEDFCDLVTAQVRHFERYAGRRFNTGGGRGHSLSLLEATALCQRISGRKLRIGRQRDDRPADVRIYIGDSTDVSAIDGWRPRRDAESTLLDIHQWLESEGEPLRIALGW